MQELRSSPRFFVRAAAAALGLSAACVYAQSVLKFEVEHYTTPKDAWQVDRSSDAKWNLWSTDSNAKQKWSEGVVFQSPLIMEDRKTPEEGAPVLHTRITDIPNGKYLVELTTVGRGLALSFDAGKTWEHKRARSLGAHRITDGVFELWVDDRYALADPERRGSTYYDAIVFTPILEASNGIVNGGFEAIADGVPVGWSAWSRKRGAATWASDEGVKHGGARSVRVEHTDQRDWALTNAAMFAVEPKQIFTVSAWVKTEAEAGSDGNVSIAVVAFGNGERISWSIGSASASGTNDWTELRSSFRVPARCDQVQVRFTGAAPLKAWLDDVTLKPGMPPRLQRPQVNGWAKQRVVEKLDRGVVAAPTQDGKVYVGWRLLDADPRDIAFHVYRQAKGAAPQRLTKAPLTKTTDFVDAAAAPGQACEYWVRTVLGNSEGAPSRRASVCEPDGYVSIKLDGEHQFQKVGIADLDGDGRWDFVIKQPHENIDPANSYWYKSPETYKLEAYGADGGFLWRYDLGWAVERGIWYSPYVVFDLDGDGKAEVAAKTGEGDPRSEDGRVREGAEYVTIIDGMSGREVCRAAWPSREGIRNYNLQSRNQICVAYLDGKTPCLIVARGTYGTIKLTALQLRRGKLEELWAWDNRNEPGWYRAQGAHIMHAADVDGDGREEVVIGSAVVDDNGVGLWSTGFGHPDFCYVGDIDPARPGLELFYGIEPRRKDSALCLVDAKTGEVIWALQEATNHVGSDGMCADIDAAYPGLECHANDIDRERKFAQSWIFSAGGQLLSQEEKGTMSRPVFWDADLQKELVRGSHIVDFHGGRHAPDIKGRVVTFADVLGDWREEIITTLPGEMRVYTTTIPAADRRVCLMQDPIYRLDVAIAAMGYWAAPMLSYCPSGETAALSLRFGAGKLTPGKTLTGELVVVAPASRALAGRLALDAGDSATLTCEQSDVAAPAGGVLRIPLQLKPGFAAQPLANHPPVRVRASLTPAGGGEPLQAQAAIPVADVPLTGTPMVQAEDLAGQGGGKVKTRNDKLASVGNAISHWDQKGHWLEWRIELPAAGDYHFAIRYSAPHESVRDLLVDSRPLTGAERLRFPPSGGFGGAASDNWAHLPVRAADGKLAVLRLDKGAHTIRMTNVCGKGLNLDYLAFIPARQ